MLFVRADKGECARSQTVEPFLDRYFNCAFPPHFTVLVMMRGMRCASGQSRFVNPRRIPLQRNLRISSLRAVHNQVYDRSFGTVVGVTRLPFASSWIKAVQFSKLDESAKLGFVVRQYP